MSHKVEPGNQGIIVPANPNGTWESSRIIRFLARRCCLCGVCFLASSAVLAEETAYLMPDGPLLAYMPMAARSQLDRPEFAESATLSEPIPASFTVPARSAFATSLMLSLGEETAAPIDERRFASLFRELPSQTGLFSGNSLVLFRQKLPSRYNYDRWAKVNSGYGQFFRGADPIGRSRTNGVGVQDEGWLYVKMSFTW